MDRMRCKHLVTMTATIWDNCCGKTKTELNKPVRQMHHQILANVDFTSHVTSTYKFARGLQCSRVRACLRDLPSLSELIVTHGSSWAYLLCQLVTRCTGKLVQTQTTLLLEELDQQNCKNPWPRTSRCALAFGVGLSAGMIHKTTEKRSDLPSLKNFKVPRGPRLIVRDSCSLSATSGYGQPVTALYLRGLHVAMRDVPLSQTYTCVSSTLDKWRMRPGLRSLALPFSHAAQRRAAASASGRILCCPGLLMITVSKAPASLNGL